MVPGRLQRKVCRTGSSQVSMEALGCWRPAADATRYDAARNDAARYDAARYDATRDATPNDATWYDVAWYVIAHDVATNDAARYDASRNAAVAHDDATARHDAARILPSRYGYGLARSRDSRPRWWSSRQA